MSGFVGIYGSKVVTLEKDMEVGVSELKGIKIK